MMASLIAKNSTNLLAVFALNLLVIMNTYNGNAVRTLIAKSSVRNICGFPAIMLVFLTMIPVTRRPKITMAKRT